MSTDPDWDSKITVNYGPQKPLEAASKHLREEIEGSLQRNMFDAFEARRLTNRTMMTRFRQWLARELIGLALRIDKGR